MHASVYLTAGRTNPEDKDGKEAEAALWLFLVNTYLDVIDFFFLNKFRPLEYRIGSLSSEPNSIR